MRVSNSTAEVSADALAMIGAQHLAYVKPQVINGMTVYLVFAANGEQIGGFASKEVAFAVCRQNELEPLSVH